MELLKQRIRKDGLVKAGNVLKVDSFLNHQMDVRLFAEIGKEFKRRFAGCGVNKILTIEASGIGIACIAAQYFDVPVVLQRRARARILMERCSPPGSRASHTAVCTISLSRKSSLARRTGC